MAENTVAFTPIACTHLDKANAEWARKYLAKLEARLETDGDDPEFAAYACREVAAYRELLERFGLPIA
jgi:hypothetical protein